MNGLAAVFAALSLLGLAQALLGWWLVRRFMHQPLTEPVGLPGISVLKPLCEVEPMLEEALAGFCALDYPAFQIVFGVQDSADPAIAVVERLRIRFPVRDIALVVDATPHGANRKVANLINMLPAAKHDVLVIADADIHATPDYLRRLAAALEAEDVGLVTTLYSGRPAHAGLPARLGASWINHTFLPGALLARALGRQDCLGATMALRREMLERVGGLEALADHLADDNVLGQLVRAQGCSVALARAVPATTVAEATLGALFRHELRWARTIRALEPAGFAASILQQKLVWALLALLVAPGPVTVALFGGVWVGGALAAREIDRALGGGSGLAITTPVWLLPARELMSALVWIVAHLGDRVEWRGQALRATPHMREKA